jgi:pyruvate,water dikinase
MQKFVLWFNQIGKNDVSKVGGKCANLGEMVSKTDVPVPPGFAITSAAYDFFVKKNNLAQRIDSELKKMKDPNDTDRLNEVGKKVREIIIKAKIPKELETTILEFYHKLQKQTKKKLFVAVRTSATSEDLPGASFAGQGETYLNVRGDKRLIDAVKKCYASLYTNRFIFYRIQKGFSHQKVSMSVGVQMMVESKAAGVIFSLDVRNGNPNVIVIEGAWGLGEYIVKGEVTPDDFIVRKRDLAIIERKIMNKQVMLKNKKGGGTIERKVPSAIRKKPVLSEAQVRELARYSLLLEKHYKIAQDTEWALDEKLNKLFIVQTRPETVWSERTARGQTRTIEVKKSVLRGLAASPGVGAGKVKIVKDLKELSKIQKGDILVTKMTSPDMVPAMSKAAGIVTDAGGMTSHAAIVSRELGIPCVVGTEKATRMFKENQEITVDGNAGAIYEGIMKIENHVEKIEHVPRTRTHVYVNLGIPEEAKKIARMPVDGVGLMREEFILASDIGEHPLAMIEQGRAEEFIEKLSHGIRVVAKAFYPRPVVLRLSDFKTNEYKALKGGEKFEPDEANPMIGWRGCSRYITPSFEPAFRLELKAVKRARSVFKNIHIMLPFPRTISEVKRIEEIMKEEGLERGPHLKIWLMAEIPSNIFLADKFSDYCDGFSIGSNDLTQLILGVDRDSELLGKMGEFDEKNEAVKRAIKHLIEVAHNHHRTVSICGQAPSEYPEYTKFLVDNHIDSISVNPDVIMRTKKLVAEAEGK